MKTTQQLIQYKRDGRPIVVLTAADYPTAQLLDDAGVDVILVGDSLGMVTLGYDNTLPLTLTEMMHHAKAVRRGVKQALLVFDLPFLSYQVSLEQAILASGQALKEAGAQAVKLEGGYPRLVETVAHLVQVGIPVMGHLGLTPQSIHQLGGFRKQGRSPEDKDTLMAQAIALQEAGAFAVILEHIPADLAHRITQSLEIPTIGIGAGPHCDGQVLVTSDVLGLSAWQPPFAKSYADLRGVITQAVQAFSDDVRQRQFPHSP
ncbi:MAG: 3-methyl-2-oxobutanoate hydroxymethyltransferase [Elainellaceae cyanobacterium]